jgi:hypothetical protein
MMLGWSTTFARMEVLPLLVEALTTSWQLRTGGARSATIGFLAECHQSTT